jgi:hypothetical protein
MGLSLSQIRNEKEFKAATSLSREKFNSLSILFSNTYKKIYAVSIEESQQNMSRKFVFPNTDELLFFVLFSLKNALILEVKGLIFGIPASTADYNFKKGLEILHRTMEDNTFMPARNFSNEAEFLKYFERESALILDVTEFKVERPSNDEAQKEIYLEKKIHSRKALIITNKEKEILYVSALFTGKTHDYEILKRSIPKNTDCFLAKEILVDLGFIGIKKDYKIENLSIPHKKKRVKKGESNETQTNKKKKIRKLADNELAWNTPLDK